MKQSEVNSQLEREASLRKLVMQITARYETREMLTNIINALVAGCELPNAVLNCINSAILVEDAHTQQLEETAAQLIGGNNVKTNNKL